MSLNKNKKILKIRKKLDILDNKMLNIIKIRTNLVHQVLQNKTSKKQIVDKKRIDVNLKNIKKKSIKKKLDVELTRRIWSNMIKAYIDFEYRKFKKKKYYLLCGGSFFSIKYSCFLVSGLYFFNFNLTLAFSPFVGFFT